MKRACFVVAVFGLALGCKKPQATSSPYAADAAGPGFGGKEKKSARMESERAPAPEMDFDDMGDEAMAEPSVAAGGELASPPPAGVTKGKDKPSTSPATPDPEPDAASRYIVYTASMNVSVFNLEDAMAKAEAIPEAWGGYIQSMSIGSVVLRIPSKSLRKVMDSVAEYGVVEQRSLQSQDVTAEFVDIESRLRALEETHKQLLGLLTKARTVKEALEVRQALDRITSELEVLKGRMRQLKNMITFSTLSLNFQERGPHMPTPSSNDPFPWVDDLGVEATEWR